MRIILKKILLTLICAQLCIQNTTLATTFTVTKTSDHAPIGQTGELRWAIQQANVTAGSHQILFNIPGTGPFVIEPVSDMDSITSPVVIDGYSQPGATENTLATGNNAHLQIVISGKNYTTGDAYYGYGNGLFFDQGSDGSTLKGVVINGWVNNGLVVYNANDINILGNFIGTNPTGTAQLANQTGIYMESSARTVIGSASPADRNIIAGSFFFFNNSACVVMNNSPGAIIKGNYIGTNAAGTAKLGNSLAGITCIISNNSVIGGTTAAEKNVVSGHVIVGISIEVSSNIQIMGNYIGTNVNGTSALGNSNIGISINGSGQTNSSINNIIVNNLISGNYVGIRLGFFSSFGANQNIIRNNYIGTDYTGNNALPNKYGIMINDNSNTIGGNSVTYRNIISANTLGGMLIYGGAKNNVIQNNYIGLNKVGAALPNKYGIQLGLLGGKGAASINNISTNSFGGGNTVKNVYS